MPTPDYNVGDWVECIDPGTQQLSLGRYYRVTAVSTETYVDRTHERSPVNGFNLNRFRRLPFQVGDRLMWAEWTNFPFMTYTVIDIDADGVYIGWPSSVSSRPNAQRHNIKHELAKFIKEESSMPPKPETPTTPTTPVVCPTPEAIRTAAQTSPEAKKALQTLFPAVFTPRQLSTEEIKKLMDPRLGGKFGGHGLFLRDDYDWKLVRDVYGLLVLTATEKAS